MGQNKQTFQHNQNIGEGRERGTYLSFPSSPERKISTIIVSLEVVGMVTGSNVEAFQGVEAKGNMAPKTGDTPLRKH